jgi:hypothetical protein
MNSNIFIIKRKWYQPYNNHHEWMRVKEVMNVFKEY